MVAFASPFRLTGSPEAAATSRPGPRRSTDTHVSTPAYPRLAAEDRRIFTRSRVSMRVSGRRLDHSVDARREPVLNLNMRDVSVGGLAAVSQTALNVGERVAIFFPPQGPARGWDAYGRVVRVEPSAGAGYRVAVSFDAPSAA